MVNVHYGAVLIYDDTTDKDAEVTITGPKNGLLLITIGDMEKLEATMKIEGDKELFNFFVSNLNQFDSASAAYFNIIEP